MNKLKFTFFDKCILCNNKLPPVEQRTGDGEHVFPKNIFGFWKSRDICEDCMRFFGKEIDKLPDQNYETLKAKRILKLDTKEYIEGAVFEGIDSFNNDGVDFVVKNDKPRIKYIKKEDYFQISEEKFESVGIEWIKKNSSLYIDNETLNVELNKLKEDYKKTEYGSFVNNEKLKVKIRKSQAKTLKMRNGNSKSLNKLVAKVAIIFLAYFLCKEDLEKVIEIDKLKNFIIKNSDISEFLIYRCDKYKSEIYKKHHFVKIEIYGNIIFVYVVFFGYISYIVNLRSKEILSIRYPNLNGEYKDVESAVFALDFSEKRKMFIELKLKDEEDYLLTQINME
jgi:hypothetical protein